MAGTAPVKSRSDATDSLQPKYNWGKRLRSRPSLNPIPISSATWRPQTSSRRTTSPSAATRPPEAPDGLNIEGLAATPNGKLLIGFRNPIPGGLALVVPIENPKGLVKGKKAKFGSPIELDLGGRGIRSIELVGSSYLVVAGPPADSGSFALYRWSGKFGDAATVVQGIDFKSLHPEALFALPGTDTVQVLSDDGGVETDGVACKDRDKSKQSFRSTIIRP